MVAAEDVLGVDGFNVRLAHRGRAVRAEIQLAVRFFVQLRIGEGFKRHVVLRHRVAGVGAVVVRAAVGVVVQHGVVVRNRNLPPLPVLPDDHATQMLPVVPQPLHVQSLRVAQALNADAAVAGARAELGFVVGV